MNFLQRIKDGAGRATEKAQHAVEINKINSQIANIKHDMSVNYTEMGRIFYEGYRAQDMSLAEERMMELSAECDTLQDEIDELREKIALLKNERVCVCGHVSDLDANFCPKCGRALTGNEKSAPVSHAQAKPEAAATVAEEEIQEEEEELFPDLLLSDEEIPSENYDLGDFLPEEKEEFDAEWERRRLEEMQRESERQQELDERIRYWKENNQHQEMVETELPRETVKCQICAAELPKGSKWCPHCGAEQI